ncbi:transcriptional regulator family: Zinc finger, GRF-type [Trichoderma aggressivum f. europaeum]|uniref:Transcriptional regulator family: Zinc finger, GRF-type n=1 Tax=Trichoderma aggressivum f. europaeum TaxID=173218 RepID=A0AAE1IH70_9HYPO|nr:transcriptional regulator family: Zinc finger, GRF-type [Trichoderma aggressivum f. europaeum]
MATTTPSSNRFHNVYPSTPTSEKRRLKGLWQRNEWWCNCDPRAKAVPRAVTADTPNLGKWFWACPLRGPDGCGFFLWFEEAKLREISLFSDRSGATPSKLPSFTQTRLTDIGFEILGDRRRSDPGNFLAGEMDGDREDAKPPQRVSSSQPEAETASGKGKGKGKAVVDAGPASYEPLTPGPSAGAKRKHDVFAEDDFDDLGSDEERQLADMTDKSVEKLIREQAYDDPKAADGEDGAFASSSRPVARTLFPQAQSSTKRSKSVSFEEPEPFPPTPTKSKDAQSSPTNTQQTTPPSSMDAPAPTVPSSAMTATQLNDDEEREDNDDVAEQVMCILQKQSIKPSVLESVRNILATSTRRARGIAMGRDSARAALNEKKIKIARMQERIAVLENEKQSLNGQITNIKASLMKMYEDN